MTIFIIGAGFTGMQLAKMLVLERNKVVLIDNDAEKVRHASDALDCTVIEADGNSIDVLEQAGIASANAFVALTGDDEVFMEGDLAYQIRPGLHYFSRTDWNRLCDFVERKSK